MRFAVTRSASTEDALALGTHVAAGEGFVVGRTAGVGDLPPVRIQVAEHERTHVPPRLDRADLPDLVLGLRTKRGIARRVDFLRCGDAQAKAVFHALRLRFDADADAHER